MPDASYNEKDLVKRCQQGDLQAYRALYHQFEQPLLRLGLRMLRQQQDAEDAVQETFVRLHRSISNFEFRSTLSTYLFRIMTNVCFDSLKKHKQRAIIAIPEEPAYTPQDPLRLKLEHHISELPDRMRACFVMFAIEGFKQREIADTLDVSVGAVKAHIYEAKNRLKKALTGDTHEL